MGASTDDPGGRTSRTSPLPDGAAPDDETGWQALHGQMFDPDVPRSGFGQWKVLSVGVHIARSLASARNRARSAWMVTYGPYPELWPLPHPPLVLWIPDSTWAGCLRCTWIDTRVPFLSAAAVSARSHAAHHVPADSDHWALLAGPIAVWRRDGPADPPGPETAE